MVELVMLVCLMAQPAKCETVHPAFVPPMSISACMKEGQVHAIEWLKTRPGWTLRRWSCEPLSA